MKIGIPKEMLSDERRVAATPETVSKMVKAGMDVLVESGAGMYAHIDDKEYQRVGAKIESNFEELLKQSDVILKVQRPIFEPGTDLHEIYYMKDRATLIGFLYPLLFPDIVNKLNEKKITAFSLDMLQRSEETQSMDALRSMSTIAGYKSIIIAAYYLGKVISTLTTAMGTTSPVKILVIGTGVAGLQAISTAKQLGCAVIAMDNKPQTAEQVKKLGAEFILLKGDEKEEQQIIRQHINKVDVVIASAQIPGKRAPLLITEEMVQEMKPGSVIVDLAIEQKGNCTLTKSGKVIVKNEVTIIGFLNIPSTVPIHSSELYAKNIWFFLHHLAPDGKEIKINLRDEITESCLITYQGKTVHPMIKQIVFESEE